ncbi:MAG: pilus assembly FimT family protein [Gammaproteobacteria bacterium]
MLRKNIGFTLVELMGVVAIIGVLALLAAPSFKETMQQQRVEGAAEALLAALNNAKSEAIKQNSTMRIVFTPSTVNSELSTWCYGMVVVPTPDTTPATTCNCTVADSCLKGSVVKSTDYTGVTITLTNAGYRTFNPLRGTSNGGTVTFSGGSNKTLNVITRTIGRVRMCKPDGSTIANYKDCS